MAKATQAGLNIPASAATTSNHEMQTASKNFENIATTALSYAIKSKL